MQSKNERKANRSSNIYWHDRKRIFGLPITFTKYSLGDGRLIVKRGAFKTTTDELLLYRIIDIRMERSMLQKLVGVGTVTLYCADRTDSIIVLENIKNPNKLRKMISDAVIADRLGKGLIMRELYDSRESYPCHY
ncbi:MAG: PH domain-containing protein [Eubacteriaceae bacterium]|nr:PH domain-containing protein [Eubacteriaceae bacterium]